MDVQETINKCLGQDNLGLGPQDCEEKQDKAEGETILHVLIPMPASINIIPGALIALNHPELQTPVDSL